MLIYIEVIAVLRREKSDGLWVQYTNNGVFFLRVWRHVEHTTGKNSKYDFVKKKE